MLHPIESGNMLEEAAALKHMGKKHDNLFSAFERQSVVVCNVQQ